jgi:hypothetical protein
MNKALVIGINYPGTDYELRGCINDADDWTRILEGRKFGVTQLLDSAATRDAILKKATTLVTGLKPGEVGVIAYSGHGTWFPDINNEEPDGRVEAICPADMGDDGTGLITGPEFRDLWAKIPTKAVVVFMTDSCHSGTVFRLNQKVGISSRRVRFIPPAHLVKRKDLVDRVQMAYGQPEQIAKPPLPGLVHFSGCRDMEYSADAFFNGRFNGAFTYFATRAFELTLANRGSYLDAFTLIRSHLPNPEYTQTPLINATPKLKAARLLG